MTATTVSARPVLADILPGGARTARPAVGVRDVALVLGGAAFVAVVGQAVVPLPFTPCP